MGIEDFFTSIRHVQGRELDDLARKFRKSQRKRRSQTIATEDRLDALEYGLGRVALLARTLAELGLTRGAFTKAELEAMLEECDLADGVGDGALDPKVALPGETRTEDLKALAPPPPDSDQR